MEFRMPPHRTNHSGRIRRVGYELEYTGISLEDTAKIVRQVVGGHIERESTFVYHIPGYRWGEFRVEIDLTLLKDRQYAKYLEIVGIDVNGLPFREDMEEMMTTLAATVVPCEIVSPPIPLTQMPVLDRVRRALRAHEAQGTKASIFYAFGLHINPEVPSLKVQSLRRHLQAFLVSYPRLLQDGETDWTRRLVPFINEFPAEYVQQVLEPDYRPDMAQFMDDYLAANPTRNRPLDMLSVFAYIDGEKVAAALGEEAELVQPRPTYHYRLPNSRVNEPDWTIAEEWNRWVELEVMAHCPARLERRIAEYA